LARPSSFSVSCGAAKVSSDPSQVETERLHLLIRALGHEGLVVEAGEDAHRVVGLDQVDGGLKLEAEVDELPADLLASVLLLLENERLVVEELLEFL